MNKKELLAKGIIDLENIKANLLIENKNIQSGYEKLVKQEQEANVKLANIKEVLASVKEKTEIAKKDKTIWDDRNKKQKANVEKQAQDIRKLEKEKVNYKKELKQKDKELEKSKRDLEKEKKGSFQIKQDYKLLKQNKQEINKYYKEINLTPPYGN